MSQGLRYFVAMGVILSICTAALAADTAATSPIPNAHKAGAYTERQFRLDLLAFNLRTTVGAYKKIGHRDPRWDDLALRMMAGRSVIYTNNGCGRRIDQVPWRIPNVTGHDEAASRPAASAHTPLNWHTNAANRRFTKKLDTIAKKLLETPCDDPMALYCAMQMGTQSPKKRLVLAQRVYKLMIASHYSNYRKAWAANYLWQQLKNQGKKKQAKSLEPKVVDLMVAMLTQKDLPAGDQRFVESAIYATMENDMSRERWKEICTRAQAAQSPYPWLVETLSGEYEIDAAWDARGSDWASSVTDKGWRGFYAHLMQAKALLTEAWKRKPQWPQAPAHMITVAAGLDAGTSRTTRQHMRLWFDRAVKAQFDYDAAYQQYIWFLYPRWYGSNQLLYQFGTACLNTGRYDTHVPWFYITALRDIQENQRSYQFWRRPGVYANIVRCSDGMAAGANTPTLRLWYQSFKVAAGWRCAKYQPARRLLDKLGKKFDPGVFARLGAPADVARAGILAYTTKPAADALAQAHELWSRGRTDQAAKKLRDASDKPAKDKRIPFYLRYAATMAQWVGQTQNGGWTTLAGDHHLVGWEIQNGKWHVNTQGALVGTTGKGGARIKCRHNFGYHIEIKGHVTFQKFTDKYPDPGVAFQFNDYNYWSDGKYKEAYNSVSIHPGLGVMISCGCGEDKNIKDKSIAKSFNFDIQQWDDHVRVTVNGKTIVKNAMLPNWPASPSHSMAIGIWAYKPGNVVVLDSLRLRKLQARPVWISQNSASHGGTTPTLPPRPHPHRNSPPPAPGS